MKLCRLFGIDVLIDSSWFLFVTILMFMESAQGGNALIMLGILLLLFLGVLIHEYAHALTARRLYGIQTRKIVLMMFGGAAFLDRMPWGGKEVVVGVVGPVSSFVLAGLAYPISLVFDPHGVVGAFAFLNFILGAFNLLPVFPMDGGRMLRGALHACGVNIILATQICLVVGLICVVTVFAIGLLSISVFTVIIFAIMMMAGFGELRMVKHICKGERI